MNIKTISMVVILMIALTMTTVSATITNNETNWDIIHTYWNVLDLNYKFSELKESVSTVENYKKEYTKLENLSITLSDSIISDLKKNDDSSLVKFSNFYKSLEEHQKPAFEVVIGKIIKYTNSLEIQKNVKWGSTATLYPGYGYADPKYKYKKGLEVSREVVSSFFQDEEHTVESEKSFEGSLDIEIAAELKNDPSIKEYREMGEPFKVNLGGHFKFFIKASFITKDKLVTNAKKQYIVNRVWYELFRAKKSAWSSSEWELCGKTYENQTELGMTLTISVEKK